MHRSNRRRYKCFVLIVCLSWVCILLMHAKLEDQSRYNDMFRGKFKSLLFLKEGKEGKNSANQSLGSIGNIKSRKSDDNSNKESSDSIKKRSKRGSSKESEIALADQIEDGLILGAENELILGAKNGLIFGAENELILGEEDELILGAEEYVQKRLQHNEEKEAENEELQIDKRENGLDMQIRQPEADTFHQDQMKRNDEPDKVLDDSKLLQQNRELIKAAEDVPDRYRQSLREEVNEKVNVPKKASFQENEKEKQVNEKPHVPPIEKRVEKKMDGLGEMGRPVQLTGLTEEEQKLKSDGWDQYQYNVFASDKISLHRSLSDKRDSQCKKEGRYLPDLPSTSVIITFYNEAWSVLLRTIYSILDRTPEHLIEELLLIDDFSSLDFLKEELDEYVSKIPKVRIIHNKKREGLMRSRIIGAKEAKSKLLTYIDSHCEANEGWLEPLLDVVQRNRTFVAVPIIDIINDETFGVGSTGCGGAMSGGFDWRLVYKWEPGVLPPNRQKCDNFETPAMAGGLFTIDKDFFEKLGYYDEKLEVWGGENIELSLKLWMCGGGIKIVPCSHVAHVYRGVSPYVDSSQKQFGSYILNNYARVARVWLEDHAPYYFQRAGRSPEEGGDVTEALKIKNSLQCKSFQWYLDNIYPQLYDIKAVPASGSIMNLDGRKLCLDTMGETSGPLKLYYCHHSGGNQYWSLTKAGEIRQDRLCATYYRGQGLTLGSCSSRNTYQKWKYQDGKIIHRANDACLTTEPREKNLVLKECTKDKSMKWKFQYINKKTMEEYNKELALGDTRN